MPTSLKHDDSTMHTHNARVIDLLIGCRVKGSYCPNKQYNA